MPELRLRHICFSLERYYYGCKVKRVVILSVAKDLLFDSHDSSFAFALAYIREMPLRIAVLPQSANAQPAMPRATRPLFHSATLCRAA
jgi:hypothetical protein